MKSGLWKLSQSDKEESMEHGRSTQKNGGKLGAVTAKGAQSFQKEEGDSTKPNTGGGNRRRVI